MKFFFYISYFMIGFLEIYIMKKMLLGYFKGFYMNVLF